MAVSKTLPVASTTAILQPVRKPGSRPRVQRGPAGAANNKSCRLRAKTLIASVSADSRSWPNRSVSKWLDSFTRQVQRTTSASHLSAGRSWFLIANCSAMITSQGCMLPGVSSPMLKLAVKKPSLRPRKIASARCEGTLLKGSSCSK